MDYFIIGTCIGTVLGFLLGISLYSTNGKDDENN